MEVLQDTYKDTKIGRIPKGWELISFGDLGEYYGGLSGKTKVNFGSGKPYIPFMNIMANDIIDVNYFDLVEIKGDEKQNKAVKGDVFFNTSSETPEEVGMCAVLLDDISDLYLNSFCFGFRLNEEAKKRYLPEYISRFMNSGFGRRLMFPLAQGMTRYNLSKKYFVKLEIPFPSLPEQQKIADILFTVDEQITTTDKIIEKSKELKKGLMQKLFSEGIGHTEFKDTKIGRIPKDWEMVKIKEVCSIEYGKDQKKVENPDGKYGIYGTGGLMNYSDKYLYNKPSVLIGRKGTIDKPRYIDIPFWTVDTLFYTKVFDDVDVKWFYYKCVSIPWRTLNEATGVPSLNRNNIYSFKIAVPPLHEQQKIAAILSEADAKIEKEKSQKAQLETLKKGLMQQILTGKKRVKV